MKYFIAILFLLNVHLLDSYKLISFDKSSGSMCLDGSPYGMYYSPGEENIWNSVEDCIGGRNDPNSIIAGYLYININSFYI